MSLFQELWQPESETAADLLVDLKTVDGSGSGLDADLLDGNHADAFVAGANGITAIVGLTQAAYDALTPKVLTTLYVITE